jgi:hypothetical protein
VTEQELYQFYNEKVKIIYSEIEARNNKLPVELLFEIHAAFDHLKRFHIDGEPIEQCAEEAFSHLKRGMLDAFKLKLKYFNTDYNALIKQKVDLRIIDSGQFLPKLLETRKNIIKTAKDARLFEGKKDIDLAFEKWYETSDLIDQCENHYFDLTKIQWAKRQGFFRFAGTFFIGVLTGIIGSLIVSYIQKLL